MPTQKQVITIQMAVRAVGLTDAQYRLLLRNVAGVESSKQLNNDGVEDVMAVLEDSGANKHPAGPRYWRDRVARRGCECGPRAARKLETLAAESRYPLDAMIERMTGEKRSVGTLSPKEAYDLIEAYKAIIAREPEVHLRSDADLPPEAGAAIGEAVRKIHAAYSKPTNQSANRQGSLFASKDAADQDDRRAARTAAPVHTPPDAYPACTDDEIPF